MSTTSVESIEQRLQESFSIIHLDVQNESHLHSASRDRLTHIKIVLVSSDFSGKNLLTRHRAIYNCLSDEMKSGLHAVSIHAYTPSEWLERNQVVPGSPQCRGGSKHDNKT